MKECEDPSGKKFAIKLLDKSNSDTQVTFSHEVGYIQSLQHNNIVNIIDAKLDGIEVYQNGKQKAVAYIVLELVSGGEYFDFIAINGAFNDKVCRFYFKQILDGLNHLH